MDKAAHRRFLEYLEKFPYFAAGMDQPQLTREDWLVLDTELRPLLPRLRAGECSPEERARGRALRRLLLVD